VDDSSSGGDGAEAPSAVVAGSALAASAVVFEGVQVAGTTLLFLLAQHVEASAPMSAPPPASPSGGVSPMRASSAAGSEAGGTLPRGSGGTRCAASSDEQHGQQRGKGRGARGRADAGPRLVDKNALSARGSGPSRQSRSPSPDSPPAKRAASADSSGYETDTPDEVQQEAVRRVCGALGMREQFEAAMAAGELLEMLESLPRGAVEASVRLMRGYNRTGEWPEPILTSPAPQRGRSPSPVDEWSDG